MPFEFGAVGGVRWCSTQVATINLSAGKKTSTPTSGYRGSSNILNDVYTSYIYGREAIGTVGLGNMHAANSLAVNGIGRTGAVIGFGLPGQSMS